MAALSRWRKAREEGGAVLVLVAIALPILGLFVMFALDVAHWYDYSRNLQNRADAAALAAGVEYGGTCATANPSPTAMAAIGQVAQNYSGAGAASDLYYPFDASNTRNVPNLTAGTLDHYHVLINSTSLWQPGQTSATQSFTMKDPATGVSTVCDSMDEDGNTGPMTDIKVTQDHLPLLVPLVGFRPTISAHARVSLLQGTIENGIRPVAVRDPNATLCVWVDFVNASTNAVITTLKLKKDANGDPYYPTGTLWDNPLGDNVQLPAAADVYAQPFLSDCSGNGTRYDDTTNSGLNWINTYGTTTPTAGQAPQITTGGVILTGCNVLPDNQYFTSNDCSPGITANLAFAPGIPTADEIVTAVDSGTGNTYTLTNGGAGTVWTIAGGGGMTGVTAGSGQHAITINWEQQSGSIGTDTCTNKGGNKCKGSFGVQQQVFGACNGCGDPDESGPIVAMRLHLPAPTDPMGSSGRNAFPNNDNPSLVVEVVVQGLGFDKANPSTPPTVLRVGTSTDQATGLIDCGQGSGANADANAITNGCPLIGTTGPNGCQNPTFCAPLKIYDQALHPNGICNPELRATANPTYTDCVNTISGTRRAKIPGAFADRIVVNGVCSNNNWTAYAQNPSNNPIPPLDPRVVILIITAPFDLSKNTVVPIRNFAAFYITGWDTSGSLPNCTNATAGNDPFPGKGKSKPNGAIWGHWIYYTDPNAGGNPTEFCDPKTFGVCATALTR